MIDEWTKKRERYASCLALTRLEKVLLRYRRVAEPFVDALTAMREVDRIVVKWQEDELERASRIRRYETQQMGDK